MKEFTRCVLSRRSSGGPGRPGAPLLHAVRAARAVATTTATTEAGTEHDQYDGDEQSRLAAQKGQGDVTS